MQVILRLVTGFISPRQGITLKVLAVNNLDRRIVFIPSSLDSTLADSYRRFLDFIAENSSPASPCCKITRNIRHLDLNQASNRSSK
jgi:hypothetical protein